MKSPRISITVSPKVAEKIAKRAQRERISVSNLAARMIEDALKPKPRK